MQTRRIRILAMAFASVALPGFATMMGAAQAPTTPSVPARSAYNFTALELGVLLPPSDAVATTHW